MVDPWLGRVVGGCRLERFLGRGGMGAVYLANQLVFDRPVAVKLIASELANDERFRARFAQESKIAASIAHPHVVAVHDSGDAEGTLYLVMAYIAGSDLSALIVRQGPLDPEHAAVLIAQIAAALDAAHLAGLVHRDVKPANILVADVIGTQTAYLADFGLAKHAASASRRTRTGQWVGTIDYVAPEQIDGRSVDARADIYALGCVLYHTITGKPPYPRDSDVAKMHAHLHEPPPSPSATRPGLPHELDVVVTRALAKDPAHRFASAGDLGKAATLAAQRPHAAIPDPSIATSEVVNGATRSQAADHIPPGGEQPPNPPRKRRTAAIVTTWILASLVWPAAVIFVEVSLGNRPEKDGVALLGFLVTCQALSVYGILWDSQAEWLADPRRSRRTVAIVETAQLILAGGLLIVVTTGPILLVGALVGILSGGEGARQLGEVLIFAPVFVLLLQRWRLVS